MYKGTKHGVINWVGKCQRRYNVISSPIKHNDNIIKDETYRGPVHVKMYWHSTNEF